MQTNFDIIILGGGPAGMTAGIYSARSGLKVLLIEKAGMGGQVALTGEIANYPGFAKIDGFALSQEMFTQMTNLGVETVFATVEQVNLIEQIKSVKAGGVTYYAPAIILSMGASSRGLGLPNEKDMLGKGLSYCAVCDGAFFRNKIVAIVGGGNTALQDVLYLNNIVDKIYLIHRRDNFRAEEVTTQQFDLECNKANTKIIKKLNCVVQEISGENKLNKLVIKNLKNDKIEEIEVDGLFVAIGRNPQNEVLDGVITLDQNGYIITDKDMRTNVEGVFAAGDITQKNLRQIATAVSDGAIAGTNASVYVKRLLKTKSESV